MDNENCITLGIALIVCILLLAGSILFLNSMSPTDMISKVVYSQSTPIPPSQARSSNISASYGDITDSVVINNSGDYVNIEVNTGGNNSTSNEVLPGVSRVTILYESLTEEEQLTVTEAVIYAIKGDRYFIKEEDITSNMVDYFEAVKVKLVYSESYSEGPGFEAVSN